MNGKDVGGRSYDPISGITTTAFDGRNWGKEQNFSQDNEYLNQDWTQGIPPHGTTAPTGPGSPHYQNFTITLRHTTFDGTPLDERSAQQRDINLHITQHSQETNIHASSGIWTHNCSKQSATEPWLGPHGDWDQRNQGIPNTNQECLPLTTTFRDKSA